MNHPAAVLCVLVAACSSAPSADVTTTTVAHEVTTTAVHEVTTTASATVSTTTPAAMPEPDSAPPGESISVTETVTIVIVDP